MPMIGNVGVDEARLRRRAAIAEAYHRVVAAPRVEVAGITIIAASLDAVVAGLQDAEEIESNGRPPT